MNKEGGKGNFTLRSSCVLPGIKFAPKWLIYKTIGDCIHNLQSPPSPLKNPRIFFYCVILGKWVRCKKILCKKKDSRFRHLDSFCTTSKRGTPRTLFCLFAQSVPYHFTRQNMCGTSQTYERNTPWMHCRARVKFVISVAIRCNQKIVITKSKNYRII